MSRVAEPTDLIVELGLSVETFLRSRCHDMEVRVDDDGSMGCGLRSHRRGLGEALGLS